MSGLKGRDALLKWEATGWLARMPFLGAYELSLLLGVQEREAARLLFELEGLQWVDQLTPSSPELERDRLYALSSAAASRLAERLDLSAGEARPTLPLAARDVLQRLTRLEVTISMNRFLAELASDARENSELEFEGIRSLPTRRRGAWWPPEVEGFGWLRMGPSFAPFFVAWDRAGAPFFHQRQRVGAWYTFRDTDNPWGRDDIPPILVVSPGEAQRSQWAQAVHAAADRRRVGPLPVLLAETRDINSEGPLGPIWRRPGGSVASPLIERLVWRWSIPPEACARSAADAVEPLQPLARRGPTLRTWASEIIESPTTKPATDLERLAALSMLTTETQKRVLEWLAHHPLLSDGDLSAILRLRLEQARRVLDGLVLHGLIDSDSKILEGEASPEARYFLTENGLKLISARDGVPYLRYVRHGTVAAAGTSRLRLLLRQREHTVGANRFFVRLLDAGRGDELGLLCWVSASEATLRFSYGGATRWLRPDGAADLCWQGVVRRCFLEWDRGTVRWPEMGEKCRLYAAYYASLARSEGNDCLAPLTLVVTTSPARENVIWQTWRSAITEIPCPARFLTSVATLVDRFGAQGKVWRSAAAGERLRLADALVPVMRDQSDDR